MDGDLDNKKNNRIKDADRTKQTEATGDSPRLGEKGKGPGDDPEKAIADLNGTASRLTKPLSTPGPRAEGLGGSTAEMAGLTANIDSQIQGKNKEIVEIAQAAITGIGKVRAIEATTTEAPNGMEGQEQLLIKDVKYVHVEDDTLHWQGEVQKQLENNLGMKNRLGAARSVQSAVALIEGLIKAKERLDLIILDQEFLFADDEDIPDASNSRNFIQQFQALAKAEENKESLGKTVIVMLSGTADKDYIKEMQGISDRVIGLVSKGGKGEESAALKKILEEAGVVK